MYVASSTNLVGFEDFHIKIVREFLLRISHSVGCLFLAVACVVVAGIQRFFLASVGMYCSVILDVTHNGLCK